MTIDEVDAAGSLTLESEQVYFCSEKCRRAFEAEPERFMPERHEPAFTVKRGMTAPKFGSAASGGLENEPTPERHEETPRRRKDQ